MNGTSLLGGQIIIPAFLTLPTYVVVIGGLLAIVGAIALLIVYISSNPW